MHWHPATIQDFLVIFAETSIISVYLDEISVSLSHLQMISPQRFFSTCEEKGGSFDFEKASTIHAFKQVPC